MSAQLSFASEAYLIAKQHWRGRVGTGSATAKGGASGESKPFGKGRDPRSIGDVLAVTAADLGWTSELEQAQLVHEWSEIVGEPTATHTEVVEIRDGTVVIQCDSTAWATELRRIRGAVLTRIIEDYPHADIRELKFLAPGAPNWRFGGRVVKGRGPRDTYG